MNYTKRAAFLCCTCYIVLIALSFIPPQKVRGVELRRANVLSDIFSFSVDKVASDVELVIDTKEYEVDMESVAKQVEEVGVSTPSVESNFAWSQADFISEGDSLRPRAGNSPFVPLVKGVAITPIESYDTTSLKPLSRFYRKLLAPDSLVRIAVLGDSFIEADIITADLREALQSQYGGCGTGFAPMHSPLTQYRSTIKTTTSGWTSHNVMQHRKTPEPYSSLFPIAGWVSLPAAGATTTWQCTSARANIDSCHCVRLLFVALNDCSIEVTLNDSQTRTFNIKGGDKTLRQIELRQPSISKVKMRVASGASGFVGYGALFEGERGVVVDNYSVRSNNGQAMFWTSPAINAQIDKRLGGYDMVILQYGLNIMQSGVNKYTAYATQVEKMISYAQKCFPEAAIVVMGVSDRSYKINGIYQPMSEAKSLTEYQRGAARARGVNFWETYAAMQAQGGMSKFVANGWAGKDFTHINLKGGRQIAWALTDAINKGVEAERATMVNKIDYEPIIDSLTTHQLENRLEAKRRLQLPVQQLEQR